MQQNQSYYRAGVLLMAASFVDGELAERLVEEAQVYCSTKIRPVGISVGKMDGNRLATRILKFMARKGRPITRRDVQILFKDELNAESTKEQMTKLLEGGLIVEVSRSWSGNGRPPTSPFYALA